MPRILLIYPVTEECVSSGCPQPVKTTRIKSLTITDTSNGYSGTGQFTIYSNRYDYIYNITKEGDQLTGYIEFVTRRGKKVRNLLNPQLSCYPTLPYRNEWYGIKASGVIDNMNLVLEDNIQLAAIQDNGDKLTNKLQVNFTLTALQNETLLGSNGSMVVPYQCNTISCLPYRNDQFGSTWIFQPPLKSINQRIGIIYNIPNSNNNDLDRNTIYINLNSLFIEERIGSVQLSGRMTSYTQNQLTNSIISKPFSYEAKLVSVNNLFKGSNNWNNRLLLVDTLNPTLGLVRPPTTRVFPIVLEGIQLTLNFTIFGEYSAALEPR